VEGADGVHADHFRIPIERAPINENSLNASCVDDVSRFNQLAIKGKA